MNATKRSAFRDGWSVLGAALLLFGASGMARAQDAEPIKPRPWSVKVGVFLPSDANLTNQSSDPYWYVGVDYLPNFRIHPLKADIHVGVDIAWRNTAHMIPLTVKLIWPITAPDARTRIYGGIGIGAYVIKTRFLGSDVFFGTKFVIGVDITDRIFLEANYDWVSGFTDNIGTALRTNGIVASAGYRF